MRFRYTILYVADVAGTLEFYRQAFGVETRFLHESGDYGELDTGATTLAFSSLELIKSLGKSPKRADPAAPSFEIAFETDDVEAALKAAEGAGAEVVQAARREAWGQTTAYVRDPNGFLVEICTSVGGADAPA